MNFIDDKEKMKDLFELSKNDFLKMYSYLTEEEYENTIDKLWEKLGNVLVDETGVYIDEDFYIWKKGIEKEEIWHWFDVRITGGIGNKYFN